MKVPFDNASKSFEGTVGSLLGRLEAGKIDLDHVYANAKRSFPRARVVAPVGPKCLPYDYEREYSRISSKFYVTTEEPKKKKKKKAKKKKKDKK